MDEMNYVNAETQQNETPLPKTEQPDVFPKTAQPEAQNGLPFEVQNLPFEPHTEPQTPPPRPYNPYGAKPPRPQNAEPGFSIASLVLGICSIIMCQESVIPFAAGILAIIFSINAAQKGCTDSMRKAGLITGIIGLSISLILFIIDVILGISIASVLTSSLLS